MSRPPYRLRWMTDAKEWNALVQSFPGGEVRQGFEWGELCAARGWHPLRLGLFDGPRAVAACAVVTRSLPPVGSVMYAPRGPLWRAEEPAALTRLLEELHVAAWRHSAIFLRVSPGPDTGMDVEGALGRAGLVALDDESTTWNTARAAQTVDLTVPQAVLLQQMRRRFREHIASAARKGLVVESSTSESDLAKLHALLVSTGRRKCIPVRDFAHYRTLARLYGASGSLLLLIARLQGRMVGGILALRFGQRMTMLHTSVRFGITEGLKHGVAPVMFWDFIRRAKAAGCSVLDLGSSGVCFIPSERDSGWGVYRFKAGLGARLQAAPRYHDLVFRPTAYRVLRLGERQMMPQMWRIAAHAAGLSPWRLRRAAA